MRTQKSCHQPHGTVSRYVAGCSCPDCCEAWRVYASEAREGRRYIRRNRRPSGVRQHVSRLLGYMGVCEIAARAGVTRHTVSAIRDGRYATIKRETADALLGVVVPR